MLTVPSGIPLGPLRSQAAFPYGPPSPGLWPKWTATIARSMMLIAMSGAGSGLVSAVTPSEHGRGVVAVQYQLMLPERWILFHPPMMRPPEVVTMLLVKFDRFG